MPGSASDYLENAILDHVYGGVAYTPAATVYIALATAASDGSLTELAGNGYARVAVTNDLTSWPAAVGGVKANGVTISFPTAAPGDWATATHFGILDAAVAGNLLGWGELDTPRTVTAGKALAFLPGTLQISET